MCILWRSSHRSQLNNRYIYANENPFQCLQKAEERICVITKSNTIVFSHFSLYFCQNNLKPRTLAVKWFYVHASNTSISSHARDFTSLSSHSSPHISPSFCHCSPLLSVLLSIISHLMWITVVYNAQNTTIYTEREGQRSKVSALYFLFHLQPFCFSNLFITF